jgi:multidrug efflux pump subunit AcrA (membrane-fusion protein)
VVWTLGDDGRPGPVVVEVGITDGRHAEIVGGRLSPGDHVIVGISGGQGPASQDTQSRFGRFL